MLFRSVRMDPMRTPSSSSNERGVAAPPGIAPGGSMKGTGPSSGKILPTQSPNPYLPSERPITLGVHPALANLSDRSRFPAGSSGTRTGKGQDRRNPSEGPTPADGAAQAPRKRQERRSLLARVLRESDQTDRRVLRHQAKWTDSPHYRLEASLQGKTYELHQPGSVPPWRAINANDVPP